jgi:hypothetical protein
MAFCLAAKTVHEKHIAKVVNLIKIAKERSQSSKDAMPLHLRHPMPEHDII